MNSIMLTFLDGVRIEIKGDDPLPDYHVSFIDDITGELVYHTTIKAGSWASPNPKYYVKWRVKVEENSLSKLEYVLDLANKDVLVIFDSKSLGDNIGWIPMVDAFRKKHNCRVTVATFHNDLFIKSYPDLKFIVHGEVTTTSYHAIYRIGAYDRDYNKNRNLWRFIPLQQIASDVLGLPAEEIAPKIVRSTEPQEINEPYVCISEFSTWFAKQWLLKDGWKELVRRINNLGYKVVSISKEPTSLQEVFKRNLCPLPETIRTLQYAKAMISVSTGPSVLAWGLGVPTVIVSGCTMPGSEYKAAKRIVNDKVCHGCMNDPQYTIDRSNWKYCPSNRDYVCSRSITVDMVWNVVKLLLEQVKNEVTIETGNSKILYITPHCSTGGGPQYLLRCVEEMKAAGKTVEVVEYANISDHYVVQRNKLKALVPWHTLNGNKTETLQQVIEKFNPDIVHLHEFPERFMDASCADYLYSKDRKYKIIETPHSPYGRKEKRYWPDGFAFVSQHHVSLFSDANLPVTVVEYELDKHIKSDRKTAVASLGLNPARHHVLNVGLLCARKNQGEIFEIARKLPDIEFHFVGNAATNFQSYWGPILANKPTNCHHWGERADVERFYDAMDMFVFASVDGGELNPLAVKEAISWGMPVLMRPLDVIDYSDNPSITYYRSIDEAVSIIRSRWPVSMRCALETAYESCVG